MSDYKIGERVKVVERSFGSFGLFGTVERLVPEDSRPIRVRFDDLTCATHVADELVRVEPTEIEDTRDEARLPQEPPEPEIEPGLYIARETNGVTIGLLFRTPGGNWQRFDSYVTTSVDWTPIVRLTPEQVAAIGGAS